MPYNRIVETNGSIAHVCAHGPFDGFEGGIFDLPASIGHADAHRFQRRSSI
jgi:hypothetical protein